MIKKIINKIKPYGNLQSKNLGLLLLGARITAFISIPIVILSIIQIVSMFSNPFIHVTIVLVVPFILGAMSMFFISAILAIIVAFEESYRRRTEIHINKN